MKGTNGNEYVGYNVIRDILVRNTTTLQLQPSLTTCMLTYQPIVSHIQNGYVSNV